MERAENIMKRGKEMIIENRRVRRLLAQVLLICMLINTVMNQGLITAFAAGESGDLEKVIQVTEQEILEAAEGYDGSDPQIIESVLPFPASERKAALEVLNSQLEGTVLVSQQKLGNQCSAIVAARVHTEDADGAETTVIDDILLIGLNGNEDRDCRFVLQVFSEGGILAEQIVVTGYRPSEPSDDPEEEFSDATPSNATPSDAEAATPSDAEEATPSDAEETDDEDEDDEYWDEIELIDDISSNRVFREYYTETLEPSDVPGLVVAYEESGLLAGLFRKNADAEQEEQPVSVRAAAGEIMVMSLSSDPDDTDTTENGVYVSVQVGKGQEANYKTGEQMLITAAYTRSQVSDGNADAYFLIEFEASDADKLDQTLYVGNTAFAAIEAGTANASRLEKIKGYLGELGKDTDGAWYVSTTEPAYFYDQENMRAVCWTNAGGTGSLQVPFKYKNGVSPNLASVTAKPYVLNRDELTENYEGNGLIQFKESDPVTVCAEAAFGWTMDALTESRYSTGSQNQSNITKSTYLYPRVENTSQDWLQYTIQARPSVDGTTGVIYTSKVTLEDYIHFEGFVLDPGINVTDLKWELNTTDNSWYCYSETFRNATNAYYKNRLFRIYTADPTDSSGHPEIKELVENQQGDITGIRWSWERTNSASSGVLPTEDMKLTSTGASLQVDFNFRNLWNQGWITSTGDVEQPSIVHEATVKAEPYTKEYSGITSFEDTKQHTTIAKPTYKITKEAYTQQDDGTYVPQDQFEPGQTVYFKIEAMNYGYTNSPFVIRDAVPAGFAESSCSLVDGSLVVKDADGNLYTPETGEEGPAANGKYTSGTTNFDVTISKIPAGGSAEIWLQMTMRDSAYYKTAAATKIDNHVNLYKKEVDKSVEATAAESVYAKVSNLTDGALELSKIVDLGEGNTIIANGSDISYTIGAKLDAAKTSYSQRVTVTDTWPYEQVEFKYVSGLPADTVVTLKGENGNVLATYKASSGSAAAALKDFTPSDVVADKIRTVEFDLYLDRAATKETTAVIKGTVIAENTKIFNEVSGPGNGHAEYSIYSLKASIQKTASHISATDAGNRITEDTKVNPSATMTFDTGDVIQYDITVANKDSRSIQVTVEDVFKDIFKDKLGTKMPELFTGATLSEQTGAVFYKTYPTGTSANGVSWEPLSGVFTNGTISHPIEIPAGYTYIMRFYLTVPSEAVGDVMQNYNNTARATITESGEKFSIQASAQINTLSKTAQKASITKTVLAVGDPLVKGSSNDALILNNARWYEKEYVANSDQYVGYDDCVEKDGIAPQVGLGDYVIYRITINNVGTAPLSVYQVQDELPEGMKFRGFIEMYNDPDVPVRNLKATGDHTLNLFRNNEYVTYTDTAAAWSRWSPANAEKWFYHYTPGTKNNATEIDDAQVGVSATFFKNVTTMGVSEERIFGAALYKPKAGGGLLDEPAVIGVGKNATFAVVAEVTELPETSAAQAYTNKVRVIVPKGAEGNATADPITDILNMGDYKDSSSDAYLGNRNYTNADYSVLSATADVQIASYSPGIEKELYSHNATTGMSEAGWTEVETAPVENPTEFLRWNITLHNGTNGISTKGPIEYYIVEDRMPENMVYNSADPAVIIAGDKKYELPEPIRLQESSVLANDDKGNEQVIRWIIEKVGENQYQVKGRDETGMISANLEIPANGERVIRVGTKPALATGMRYGTYTNRADLIVVDIDTTDDVDYSYPYDESTGISHGTAGEGFVSSSNTKGPKSIYAVDSLNVFGAGATKSWKRVTSVYSLDPDDNPVGNTAIGDDDRNWVYADAGSVVTYTLYVKSETDNLQNLVLIDHLPYEGDKALTYTGDRGSDFGVSFAKNINMSVVVMEADETVRKTLDEESEYTVLYANREQIWPNTNGILPVENWEYDLKKQGNNWHATRANNDDCFKIIVNNTVKIAKDETIAVTFDAQLPDHTEVVSNIKSMEDTAWNSFGYAYEASGLNLRVEPIRVGVRIPVSTLQITKKALPTPAADTEFRFVLERRAIPEAGSQTGLDEGWAKIGGIPYVLSESGATVGGDLHTASDKEHVGEFSLKHTQTATFIVEAHYQYRIKEVDSKDYNFTAIGNGSNTQPADTEFEYYDTKQPTVYLLTRTEDKEAEAMNGLKPGDSYQFTFWNKKGIVLPETGGMGTMDLYNIGMYLMCLALGGIAFMSGKRPGKREEE